MFAQYHLDVELSLRAQEPRLMPQWAEGKEHDRSKGGSRAASRFVYGYHVRGACA